MAWPRCPECKSTDTHVEESVDDAAPVEPVKYRHHACGACGCYWHTAEKLIDVRPEKRWIGRLLVTRATATG